MHAITEIDKPNQDFSCGPTRCHATLRRIWWGSPSIYKEADTEVLLLARPVRGRVWNLRTGFRKWGLRSRRGSFGEGIRQDPGKTRERSAFQEGLFVGRPDGGEKRARNELPTE